MKYPLHLDIDIIQDDFIQVDILEQAVDARQIKEFNRKVFIAELVAVFLLAAVLGILIISGSIVVYSMLFPAVCLATVLAAHFFNKSGVDKEFAYGVNHLLENRDSHSFFSEEKGMALFYEDKCEYLTNEQRRYFDYDKIEHIKVTKLLYIFVMKKTKDKTMQGFAYMIIPRRCLTDDEDAALAQICDGIVQKYALTTWTDSQIMG